jgi:hypothetical protein
MLFDFQDKIFQCPAAADKLWKNVNLGVSVDGEVI